MKKLILHIGNHKTGTTTLQLALKNNTECLKQKGHSLFQSNRDLSISVEGNANDWVVFDKQDPYSATVQDGLGKEASKLPGTVIISAEELAWLFSENSIKNLRDQLSKYFTEIQLVCYLRRQDQHTISHYQQASKSPFLKTAIFFGNSLSVLPEYGRHLDLYLNYQKRIQLWSSVFGKENIILRLYQNVELSNENVVDDFSNLLGIVLEKKIDQQNISYGVAKTKINHLMNSVGFHQRYRYPFSALFTDSEKPLPSRQEAIDFYNHYRESNKKLNQDFNISQYESLFSDDFSFYPEESNFLWTEETANSALVNMCTLLKDGYSEIERLKDENSKLKNRLGSILNSKAWRLISAFRKLKTFLKI